MDKETLKKTLTAVANGMKFVAALTPTGIDDRLADWILVAVNQDWFLDLVLSVWSLLQKKSGPEILALVEEHVKL